MKYLLVLLLIGCTWFDPKESFKIELENYFKRHPLREVNELVIDTQLMYEYQQTSKSDTMLSVGLLL